MRRLRLTQYLLPVFLVVGTLDSCDDPQSAGTIRSFEGEWRVLYLPNVNVDPNMISHAVWTIEENAGVMSGKAQFTGPDYAPCNCPSDTLFGTRDALGRFSCRSGIGTATVLIRDTLRIISFDKVNVGEIASTGRSFDGEHRWLYADEGFLPSGIRDGDLFRSWSIHGTKSP